MLWNFSNFQVDQGEMSSPSLWGKIFMWSEVKLFVFFRQSDSKCPVFLIVPAFSELVPWFLQKMLGIESRVYKEKWRRWHDRNARYFKGFIFMFGGEALEVLQFWSCFIWPFSKANQHWFHIAKKYSHGKVASFFVQRWSACIVLQ